MQGVNVLIASIAVELFELEMFFNKNKLFLNASKTRSYKKIINLY